MTTIRIVHGRRDYGPGHVLAHVRTAGRRLIRTLHILRMARDTVRRLRLLEAEHAELLAHARAAIAAAYVGELDPTGYLAGHLEEHGQLPPKDVPPAVLVAQAYECAALVDAELARGVIV
jgi:hypothetical protein